MNRMPVLERARDRHRAVADVVRAEWHRLDGSNWTPTDVASVDADLAAGVEENHFHEAVPYVQFGLRALAQARPDPSADDDVLVALARDFFPRDADQVTAETVAHLREMRRERGDELELTAAEDYIRFGLRVLARARGEEWGPPPPARPSLIRQLFGR
jgi:hypothetical protein